ncbi:hypothetical protein RJ639_018004 [Escallonia herrerae]|uniref:Uncharacterized protein n=1 Tax=Escallonia herrerae TaxID=1293975 RepID=A0AA88V6C7_9ASTE|nr:hypothetical protein RJ639_018004 [Escallonia herrerae]
MLQLCRFKENCNHHPGNSEEFPSPYVRHSYPVNRNERPQLLAPSFFTEIGIFLRFSQRDLRKLKVFNKFRDDGYRHIHETMGMMW